jgi:Leucine rich repeat
MNDAPNAAAEPAIGEGSSEETPTVASSSSTIPSGSNEAVLAVGASISRGMPNVRGKMQLLGRDDISSPFSSQRGAETQKAYKEQKTDIARTNIEPPNASTTSNGAYPAAKMQMSSGRTQKVITDPEDVPPVCKGDSRDRGEMQQSRSDTAEPRDFSSSASATGENISNTFDALHRTEADVFSRPGAFLVVPGLPPIPAGDVSIEGEPDVTQGEANPLTPARPTRPMVLDATMVQQVPNVEMQHAKEADPAELTVGAFRRRVFVLMTLVGIIFVASTVAGVTVANNRSTTPRSHQNIGFEEFLSLLPVEYRERATFDPLTPQGQAYLWLKHDTDGLTMVGWRMLQRYCLSVVFFSLNGYNWHNRSGWLSSGEECSWNTAAALCDVNGQISALKLNENNLTGSMPDELSLLTGLTTILMKENSITGTIPKSMFGLSQLTHLDLEDNRLEGTVPLELSNMTSLEAFVAAKNLLNGTIPTELGLLSTLMLLRIHNNKFEGPLPTTLGLLRKIELFYADSNSFTGSLPTHMGRMSSLKGLIVGQNQLSGTLPSELGGLHQLEVASMSHNINIRGTIPSHLGLLVSLQQLHLDMTSLSGTIPSEL